MKEQKPDKSDFIRIRADQELKDALKAAAEQNDRQEADQARYLLRVALGLSKTPAPDDAVIADLRRQIKELQERTGAPDHGAQSPSTLIS